MNVKTYHIADGRHSLAASVVPCGGDRNVSVCGGEGPHIGAVALGIPRPGLRDPGKTSASVSVLCVTGHKDDEFARLAAHRLAAQWGCVVAVEVGIHMDDAEEADILRFGQNFERLVAEIAAGSG